jgi:peptidoglycan hydrolase-like protein with peptidoglycan-binding domain
MSPAAIYAVGRPGMKPSVVKTIKRALKDFGIDPGPIDGDFDALTASAVGAFQATKGIVVDGQVGPQTAKRLKVGLKAT